MERIRPRDALFGAAIAVLAGLAAASPALDLLRGLSIDALTALRWRVLGHTYDPNASPAVIVAVDEETYRTPPFSGTPNVTWTWEIGQVLTAVVDGGAKVAGFDIVFPTSIEQSEVPFGDETLGTRVRGFDRDYLRSLALAARAGKLVLGQVQHGDHPIQPSPGQRVAAGGQRNIRALNVHNDPDDIVRRVPLSFIVDGAPQTSFAVELASRALNASPETASGRTTLAGYRIPESRPNALTLNFDGGHDIPTYSLADLRACIAKGDAEFFRRQFDGKVVIFGTLLDLEDRKITSKRFATAPETAWATRCAMPRKTEGPEFARDSISGSYIHAAAVNNLIRRNAVMEFNRAGTGLATGAVVAVVAAAGLMLAPAGATLVYFIVALGWTAAATFAFRHAVAMPLIEPILLAPVALAVIVAYRFMVTDRDKRLLRKNFALYLAPPVIEKMVASSSPPALGGEARNITVYFSDIAGFSSFSESLSPIELVSMMNEYLSAMTDIIEEHSGFVDKYIGDAIVAVFGAPVDDPHHAENAVRAAIACQARLRDMNESDAFGGHKLGQRIGLNSGEALVGNMGSRRRFNYTVMGDMVNLASRLEGANKFFATSIIASETTVALTGSNFVWRELDEIRVKGRARPVKIFEPLAAAGGEMPDQMARAAVYAEGLACWRAQDFAGAAERFARIADADPPAAKFLQRAEPCVQNPPGAGWEPVNTLDEK